MSKYRFTPQARDDLFDIWGFIAKDDRKAAERVENAIYGACDLIAEVPLAGQAREDLTRLPLRFWIVQPYTNYIIVYDPEKAPLQIIRILHGARNLPGVLE
ncbi:MAG TPA: type II toxin-antitoxin system RelE/ParE family toxin [Candidatus Acidoferrales bacterium]|nr:type II toxin-antitoxin system RelE/ParE family toxin [Candidatus Acidoferrales bacterium]